MRIRVRCVLWKPAITITASPSKTAPSSLFHQTSACLGFERMGGFQEESNAIDGCECQWRSPSAQASGHRRRRLFSYWPRSPADCPTYQSQPSNPRSAIAPAAQSRHARAARPSYTHRRGFRDLGCENGEGRRAPSSASLPSRRQSDLGKPAQESAGNPQALRSSRQFGCPRCFWHASFPRRQSYSAAAMMRSATLCV